MIFIFNRARLIFALYFVAVTALVCLAPAPARAGVGDTPEVEAQRLIHILATPPRTTAARSRVALS